jgi:hypothetical protein
MVMADLGGLLARICRCSWPWIVSQSVKALCGLLPTSGMDGDAVREPIETLGR